MGSPRKTSLASQIQNRIRTFPAQPNGRKSPEKQKKTKIDDSEREKKLKEMMENANWREEQRSKKVNKYRQEVKEEETEYKQDHDPEFLRKQLNAAAEASTVESRIKSNKYNIQRGVGNMDSNF